MQAGNNDETKLKRFGRWIFRRLRWLRLHWSALCSFGGPLFLSITMALVDLDEAKWKWLLETRAGLLTTGLCVLLLLVGCFGVWGALRDAKTSKDKLDEAHDQLRAAYGSLFNRQLLILAGCLDLGDRARISVYRHSGGVFTMLARCSRNPAFAEHGRPAYPASEGVISLAWANGSATQANLPDPVRQAQKYALAQVEKCGMTQKSLGSMRMQSRCYYAQAIENTTLTRRVAVVVFESLDPEGLRVDDIRKQLDNGEARRISEFLHTHKEFEPDLRYAKEEGF